MLFQEISEELKWVWEMITGEEKQRTGKLKVYIEGLSRGGPNIPCSILVAWVF